MLQPGPCAPFYRIPPSPVSLSGTSRTDPPIPKSRRPLRTRPRAGRRPPRARGPPPSQGAPRPRAPPQPPQPPPEGRPSPAGGNGDEDGGGGNGGVGYRCAGTAARSSLSTQAAVTCYRRPASNHARSLREPPLFCAPARCPAKVIPAAAPPRGSLRRPLPTPGGGGAPGLLYRRTHSAREGSAALLYTPRQPMRWRRKKHARSGAAAALKEPRPAALKGAATRPAGLKGFATPTIHITRTRPGALVDPKGGGQARHTGVGGSAGRFG